VNFRDVLMGLGMYPGVDPAEAVLGGEAAGVVLETGPGVGHLAVGDRVMGLVAGGFASQTVADARMVVPIPAGWDFPTAAGVPAVFTTAWYALVDLARLRPGETILIHAAAGGVGMAAIQIAHHLGARILATAHPSKWQALRGLGVERIASSRDTSFAEVFAGQRVDVVLNSLAGDLIDASLNLLAPTGRFIEMGKTDIRDQVPDGVVYRAFDLADAGPDRTRQILHDLLALFETGTLTPLPTAVRDIRRAPEVFRRISQARHTGKNVLTIPHRLNPDHTVLITGGTGTLGRLLTEHLTTTRQARKFLLLSRTGPTSNTRTWADTLTAAHPDIRIDIQACDVTDRDALAAALAGHTLTGVYHTAGTLADTTIDNLTTHQLHTVLTPKVDAAAHLADLTRDHDLATLTLYSSAAGVLGSPGQANYAAANAYLDALAHHHRAEGRPTTSLAWGLWADRSGLTGHLGATDLNRIIRGGVRLLSRENGLALLDAAARFDAALQVPVELRPGDAGGEVPHVMRALARPARRAAAATAEAPAERLADILAGLVAGQRTRHVLKLVRAQASSVLGHADGEAVVAGSTFKEQGFDSLTAVELRNRLNTVTGLRLPATLVFDHPTPVVLTQYLIDELMPAPTTPDADSGRPHDTAAAAASADSPLESDDDLIDSMDALSLIQKALGTSDFKDVTQ
jgi:NADPH:quinone reductase-like Zn-dependent oxidoreductase/nucleoside-diphosphate-sugar epimerase